LEDLRSYQVDGDKFLRFSTS